MVPIGFGPVISLIDQESGVGVAAAGGEGEGRDAFSDVIPALLSVPVKMVGGLGDEFV